MNILTSLTETIARIIGVDPATSFFSNTVSEYVVAILLFVGLTIIFKIIQFVILKRLGFLAQKTQTDIDDTLISVVRSIRPRFYGFLALYLALRSLVLPVWLVQTLTAGLLIFIVYQAVHAVGILIDYVAEKRLKKEEGEETDLGSRAAVDLIGKITKTVLWAVGVLLILSNLGIEVTSLVAGLGIGGIAIAFALQAILKDLFSSFTIYFDKPFQIGDYIVVGEKSGTVERIGIKTTRLRALQGEEIVMSNADLTSARIHNYKHMEKRRIVFSLGVTYETPVEKLKKVPQIVKDVFKSVNSADLARVHFNKLADSSLSFEVVYYVTSADYAVYMDTQQEVNFALVESFEKEGIEFAYPTQTLHISK